jgi:hypothetical protein
MTQNQQNLSQQLFGGPQQSITALGAVKEGFLAIAPGLKDFGREVKAELKQMGAHGAHELAAALFNGGAFVMYPRGSKDDPAQNGPQHEEQATKEGQDQQQTTDRGGMGM